MSTPHKSTESAAALRQRAEVAFRESAAALPEATASVSPAATQAMLHELQVHQIELELQNEELRRAQADLEVSRAHYFDFYDLAPVGFCTVSETGLILRANVTLATRLGVNRRALVTQLFSRFIHPEDLNKFYPLRKQLLATGQPQTCELRLVPPAGPPFWAQLAATVDPAADGPPGLRVVLSELTERKQAEEALRVERENLNAIFEASPVALFILDETTNIVLANMAAVVLSGGSAAGVLQHRPGNALGCVHSLKDPRGCGYSPDCPLCPVRNGIEALIASGGTMHGAELLMELLRNGAPQQVWMKIGAEPVLLNGRRHLCVALEDITARKAQEAALRESEDRYRSLVENSPDGIGIHQGGKMVFINLTGLRMFGAQTREEMIGKDLQMIIHADDQAAAANRIQRQLAGETGVYPAEVRYVLRDGTVVPGELRSSVIQFAGQPANQVTFRDISERKRREAVLAARMRLSEFGLNDSLDQLLTRTLDEAELLTGSTIGFFHFVEADQRTLSLQTWSNNTLQKMCTAEGKGRHYAADQAGVWADALRERRPMMHNDYPSLPQRKGLPPGHAPVLRELVVPVLRNEQVVALLGIGNKPQDYGPADLECVTTLANLVWDIVLAKQAEAARHQAEEQYRLLFENALEGIYQTTPAGAFQTANPALARILGYPSPAALIRERTDIGQQSYVDPQRRAEFRRQIEADGVCRGFEYEAYRQDGSKVWVSENARVLRDAQGQVTGYEGSLEDITERKQAEAALRKSQSLLAQTEKMGKVGGWEFDIATGKQTWTEMIYDIHELDYACQPTVARGLDYYAPASRPIIEEAVRRAVEQGEPFDVELEIITAKGNRRSVHALGQADPAAGRVFGFFQDITERKRAEAVLRVSLREKEALLKEVHHRVKNNLQVVTSLLHLESRRSQQPETKAVLTDMQGRIYSMALLHESLYRSGNFAAVDLGAYLRDIATQSFRMLASRTDLVRLTLDLAPVPTTMDQAVSCGLLVNELISNCLKHGFPAGRSGEVRIALQPVAGGPQVCLRVSDTGVGLPPDFAAQHGQSLGLQLVSDLTSHLEGTLAIGPAPEAVFALTFTPHAVKK